MTKYESHYPLVSIQGPVSGQWYIIANGIWHEVKRKYNWEELQKMWTKVTYAKREVTIKAKKTVQQWNVEGSKGNVYKVVNDEGFWKCSCPASMYHRKECKHITSLKQKV